MSKITKEGYVPKLNGKCNLCGCEFEYDKRDVWLYDIVGKPTLYKVKCPYCESEIDMPITLDDLFNQKNGDFKEDVASLAKQYGINDYELKIK